MLGFWAALLHNLWLTCSLGKLLRCFLSTLQRSGLGIHIFLLPPWFKLHILHQRAETLTRSTGTPIQHHSTEWLGLWCSMKVSGEGGGCICVLESEQMQATLTRATRRSISSLPWSWKLVLTVILSGNLLVSLPGWQILP